MKGREREREQRHNKTLALPFIALCNRAVNWFGICLHTGL